MRLTAACPEILRDDANNLAMVLAESKADANTYGALGWQDREGNLYAAASFVVRLEWTTAATSPLTRPEWDAAGIIDMEAAARAQAALVVWLGGPEQEIPQASPDALTVVAGDDGLAALAAMGLTQYEAQPININTADSEVLQSLSGIGASLAQAIIDGRPWAAPADLSSLGGISAAMVDGWMADPGLVA